MVETSDLTENQEETRINHSVYLDLQKALRSLDILLKRAILAAEKVYGPTAASDPFRGLHIDAQDIDRLFMQDPGFPLFDLGNSSSGGFLQPLEKETGKLAWLIRIYGLTIFEINLIVIALAPEIDLRYERIYAYLQDDITRRKPTVELALNLLCTSFDEKLMRRAYFSSNAPLIQNGLVELIVEPNQIYPPLLAQYLKLDDQITRFLLGIGGLDSRLKAFCTLTKPAVRIVALPTNEDIKRGLSTLLLHSFEIPQALRLYFHGPPGAGKRQMAVALASVAEISFLVADLNQLVESRMDFEYSLKLLFREAWFNDALVYFEEMDILLADGQTTRYRQLMNGLASDGHRVILSGEQPWTPGVNAPLIIDVPFGIPSVSQRKAVWADLISEIGVRGFKKTDLETLSSRFRLTPGQIRSAITDAQGIALWREARHSNLSTSKHTNLPTSKELLAAARAQTGHELASLAQKLEPQYEWDDIVLPEDSLAQLSEICQWVDQRQKVLEDWGFEKKLSQGKGIAVLFAGPSGTGKTMAAEVIANTLGLDLYRIDLSGVVSKYIGETEKNLNRIFTAAENANAILFFDEADALFGKRSEVHDSHDRYANIEISYLLQKMEQYEGIAILATNLRQNLDEAFIRRLAFTVHFPFPGDDERLRIWKKIWPSKKLVGKDVDLDFLDRQFKLSGGNIRNIALAAAYLAASDGGTIRMPHLFHATQREYQKMGKHLSEAELFGRKQETTA